MKFGKLEDIKGVDFSLPPPNPRAHKLLTQSESTSFRAYVGCPVWGNRAWIGKIYPTATKSSEFLHHYARQFNTIELNTTHYRIPTREMVVKWKETSAPGFRFCPKLPQELSHRRRLINCDERLQLFCDHICLFEDRLGCVFVQLPPNFTINSLENLSDFLQKFPKSIPLAIEFRHNSWFYQGILPPKVCDLLEAHGAGSVMTDVSGRRDVLHASLTNKRAMIRFVGNQLDPTDYTRIDDWMLRLDTWVKLGLEELYFFVHEPDDVDAPDIGAYVIEQLNDRFKLNIKVPGLPNEGGQMSLF